MREREREMYSVVVNVLLLLDDRAMLFLDYLMHLYFCPFCFHLNYSNQSETLKSGTQPPPRVIKQATEISLAAPNKEGRLEMSTYTSQIIITTSSTP